MCLLHSISINITDTLAALGRFSVSMNRQCSDPDQRSQLETAALYMQFVNAKAASAYSNPASNSGNAMLV